MDILLTDILPNTAEKASVLATSRNIGLTGPISAPAVAFNGSGNVNLQTTVGNGALSISNVSNLQSTLNSKLDAAKVGSANGVAPLDAGGLVPATHLPSYVDDVLEFATQANFPATGEAGKIYIDQSNGRVFRWSGSSYIRINDAVSTADKANTLVTSRSFSLTGTVTAGAVSFNGSSNVALTTSIADGALTVAKTSGLQTALDGKAASTHTHAAADITSGTLPIARGGTGGTDAASARTALGAAAASHTHTIANVTNLQSSLDGKVGTDKIGVANGIAPLDATGLIPSQHLPSYVDDVLEFATQATFPTTGETGKIYIDQSNGQVFRWTGTTYVRINDAVSTSDKANTLATARDFSLSGVVTSGAVSFNGSGNVALTTSIADNALTISKVNGLQGALDGKSETGHNHALTGLTGTLEITQGGTGATTAAAARTALGAAATTHTHSASDITGGTLAIARGGTGGTDAASARTALGAAAASHTHTIANVSGLQDALNDKISTSLKGAASGVAPLDSNSLVPLANLPADVQEVFEFATQSAFPATGQTKSIYVDQSNGNLFRWNGSNYLRLSSTASLADKANTLFTSRSFSLTGMVTAGAVSFNGSGNVALTTSIADNALTIAKTSGLQTALNGKAAAAHTHAATDIAFGTLPIANGGTGSSNAAGALTALGAAPASHSHTIANITNLQSALDNKLDAIKVGAANGVAPLDANGLVPAVNLPSYVDDVVEYATQANFPATGETGKIYIDQSNGRVFRWTGSSYIRINDSVSTADKANTLVTSRSFSLTGTVTASAVSFNGGANVALTTTIADNALSIAKTSGLQTALDGKAASTHAHSATDITSGILPITRGGTGAGTSTAALTALGAASSTHSHALTDLTGTLSVAKGGTGSTTAAAARTALGAAADDAVVKLSGDQTLSGVKSFQSKIQSNTGATSWSFQVPGLGGLYNNTDSVALVRSSGDSWHTLSLDVEGFAHTGKGQLLQIEPEYPAYKDPNLIDGKIAGAIVGSDQLNAPSAYTFTWNFPASESRGFQIASFYGEASDFYIRGQRDTPAGYKPWHKLIHSGNINNEVPQRLGMHCSTTDDWNKARHNGWWMADGALNAPSTGWFIVQVKSHNHLWVVQEAIAFTSNNPVKWTRQCLGGENAWTPWTTTQNFGEITTTDIKNTGWYRSYHGVGIHWENTGCGLYSIHAGWVHTYGNSGIAASQFNCYRESHNPQATPDQSAYLARGNYGGGYGMIDSSGAGAMYYGAGYLYFGNSQAGHLGHSAVMQYDRGGTLFAHNFSLLSDISEKKNIEPLKFRGPLAPVTHDWIDENVNFGQGTVGFVSQWVQELYPELVREGEHGKLSIDYPKVTAVLAAQNNEQQEQIDQQANRIKELETALAKLTEQVQLIQSCISM